MSKQALIVKTKTQPGKRDEMRQLFEKHLAQRAQANEKQEVVIWCADDNDADICYLFELYSSRQAFEANAQAAGQAGWFQDYMNEAFPLLAGQPEVSMATPLWAKGMAL